MNTKIEAALMISAGALLAAGAQFAPTIGERLYGALGASPGAAAEMSPAAATEIATATPVWLAEVGHADNFRFLHCQDAPASVRSNNSVNIQTSDNRGGYTVTISGGELEKIEAEGEYTLEEEGDIVRILDPDGGVAFETSKSNPSVGGEGFLFHSFGDPFGIAMAPGVHTERAALGVGSSPLDDAMAAQLGVESGVLIEFIEPGSGADAGGLQQFDVLLSIDGEPVDSRRLTSVVSGHEPGDTVTVDVIRKGQRQSLDIVLGSTHSFAPNAFGEFDEMRRVLDAQMRHLDSLMNGQAAPAPAVRPLLAPAPRALPGLAAPKVKPDTNNPDAIDASEMAPKTRAQRFPA